MLTIKSKPAICNGSSLGVHIYGNENYFVSLLNTFDQASRKYPVFVNDCAATNTGSNNNGQVGAQTVDMSCAEAIFLLGCERSSSVIVGSVYGALVKNCNEAPDTVAVIKRTANEDFYTISYYVQNPFAGAWAQELYLQPPKWGFRPSLLVCNSQQVLHHTQARQL